MEKTPTYNFNISKLKEHFPSRQWVGSGDDFCLLEIKGDNNTFRSASHPCRFDGMLMLYCIQGHMNLSLNLNEYEITDGSVVLCTPGNIFRMSDDRGRNMPGNHYVMIAMSQKFASELRVDMKKMINEVLPFMDAPVMHVGPDISDIFRDYLALIAKVMKSDSAFADESLKSLVASMIEIMAGSWKTGMEKINDRGNVGTTRSRMIFEQFVRLVGEYHTKHRNVGFYADKLCLTPKYLSKLIKSASGRSAPEWIDAYVILEAKNMLKYSDMTIKEIVWHLNFPNQSVFYKFFKARTGMTPSGYRNS